MNLKELVRRVEQLQPDANPHEIARACLLLVNSFDDLNALEDEAVLATAWTESGLRVQAATDQHSAMTEELEALANSDPRKFSPDQIWVLVRAIKVQSQILQMYVGHPVLDV
ncbi:MAG: hypothetical protein WDZ59_05540 [Pirellulales bacterium]